MAISSYVLCKLELLCSALETALPIGINRLIPMLSRKPNMSHLFNWYRMLISIMVE